MSLIGALSSFRELGRDESSQTPMAHFMRRDAVAARKRDVMPTFGYLSESRSVHWRSCTHRDPIGNQKSA